MAEGLLSKEDFLRIAETIGIDTSDSARMDRLHRFVLGVLPNAKAVQGVDVGDTEPAMIFNPALAFNQAKE